MDESQLADLRALHERELLERQEVASVSQHWTLAQAAAWIVFRDISSVALFTPPHATGFITYLMYSDPDKKPVVHAKWHDLFRKLEAKRLVATGRRAIDGIREPIPASAWVDLIPDVDAGPYLSSQSSGASRPWIDILVQRGNVERLWRRRSEVEQNSKYDEIWIKEKYAELKALHTDLSDRQLFKLIFDSYEERFKRPGPERSTVQRIIKRR